jgi:hypothetical protein
MMRLILLRALDIASSVFMGVAFLVLHTGIVQTFELYEEMRPKKITCEEYVGLTTKCENALDSICDSDDCQINS